MTKQEIYAAVEVAEKCGIPVVTSHHGHVAPFLMLLGKGEVPYVYTHGAVSPHKWNPYENDAQARYALECFQDNAEKQGLRVRAICEMLNENHWRTQIVYFKSDSHERVRSNQWAEGEFTFSICSAIACVNTKLPPTAEHDAWGGKRSVSGEDFV